MNQISKLPSALLEGIVGGQTRILDLSYAIDEHLVPWIGDERVFESSNNATFEKNGYFTRSFWMLEHYGTHMDAPVHFAEGQLTVDQIPAHRFFGPVVVLDVCLEAAANADFQLPVETIDQWEREHGEIAAGSIVLLRTGWAARWPDVRRYRGDDSSRTMHFPGFSLAAAELLVQRRVSGLGCDTLSIDPGNSKDFPVHLCALGAGLYHLENLADLRALPAIGAYLIVAPIKLLGGSGGPVRVFALLGN